MQGDTPDPNSMLDAMGAGNSVDDIISDSAPLGKPRVISWKSGQGPSDELIGQIRDAEGSKAAARRLGLSQAQVKARSTSSGSLPSEVQDRIRTTMEGMSPEERIRYVEEAPNGLAQDFMQKLFGGS